jgi:pimeloyl-ACP methyl ester carboxylesterase
MAQSQQPATFDTYSAVISDGPNREVPARVYEPKELATEVPVVIAPGFLNGNVAMGGMACFLAGEGRRVVTFDYPRRNGTNPLAYKVETLGAVVGAVCDLFDVKQVDMWAYSEGGATTTLLAEQAPELIKSITGLHIHGLSPTTMRGLARRIAGELRSLPPPNSSLARAAIFGLQYGADDWRLTFRELCRLGPVDILPSMAAVLFKHRIPVTLGFGGRDKIVPRRDSEGALAVNNLPVTLVSLPEDAGHFHPLYDRRLHQAVNSARPHKPAARRGRPRQIRQLDQAA